VEPKRPGPVKRLFRTYGKDRLIFATWVMALTIGLLVLFMYIPIVDSFLLSLFKIVANKSTYVGLENFREAFRDELFIKSIRNTFYFVLLRVPIGMIISYVIALALMKVKQRFAQSFFLSGFFLPYITSMVAWSVVFLYLCDPVYGLFNMILQRFHLPTLYWFHDPKTAMPTIAFMDMWKYVGYSALLLFTGLQSIPSQFYEASRVDGASGWKRFWKITFPLMVPVTSMTTIVLLIACIQIFTPMYMVYNDNYGLGPSTSAASMGVAIYTQAFQHYDLNYASTLAILMFVMILFVTLISLRVSRISWEY
jgi:multiple sugar transport system permease protein